MEIEKIQRMKRGTVIIPKKKTGLEIAWEEAPGKNDLHATFMKRYAEENKIKLKDSGIYSFWWAQEYQKNETMVFQIDKYSILYIPDTVDEQQYTWFQKNRRELKRYRRLAGIICYQQQGTFSFEGVESIHASDVLEILELEIEEKYEQYQKLEQKKVEECTKNLEYVKKL